MSGSSVFQPIENHFKKFGEINNNNNSNQIKKSFSESKDAECDAENSDAASLINNLNSRASPPLSGNYLGNILS